MAKMNTKYMTVDKYAGDNLRIEALLSMDPLEDHECIYRVNGPVGMRLMVLNKDMTEAAVQNEYVNRYGVVEEEEID